MDLPIAFPAAVLPTIFLNLIEFTQRLTAYITLTNQLSDDLWVPGKQISKESGTVRSTYRQNLSRIEIIRLLHQPLYWAFSELHSKLSPAKYLTVPGRLEFIKSSSFLMLVSLSVSHRID